MSGVGPVEPGEDTRAWDSAEPFPQAPHGRLAALCARHRRTLIASAAAAVALVGGGYLYATRPQEPEPDPPAFPSQTVDMDYLGRELPPANSPSGSFSFAILVMVIPGSGAPVTMERISQPYSGLSLTSAPRPPFRTRPEFPRRIVITMHVTDCAHVPTDAGLPFLDVTLRNTRAIEDHSFILGERYSQDLSEALQVACGNDSMSLPNPKNTTETLAALPAGSHYADGANRPEFYSSAHRVPLCITSCHNKSVTALARHSSRFPLPA